MEDYIAYNLGKPWKFNQKRYESIKQLISFSTGVLAKEGSLHRTTKNTIDRYDKRDMYKRFSEDIVCGLSYMKDKKMINNQEILKLINRYESKDWYKKERVSRRRIDLLTA